MCHSASVTQNKYSQVPKAQTKKMSSVVCSAVNIKAATGKCFELHVCAHVQRWVKLGIRAG